MMVITVIAFLICWLPHARGGVSTSSPIRGSGLWPHLADLIRFAKSSSYNPVIYIMMNKQVPAGGWEGARSPPRRQVEKPQS